MAETMKAGFSRRGILRAFAATTLIAAPTYSKAFGLLRGAGDIRRVKMYSGRSGESVDLVYWVDGNYVPDALSELNHFMRDWRTNEVRTMAAHTVDIIAATHSLLEVKEPYMLLSGYRTAATNAMMRQHSRGVAAHSLHIQGEAADLRLNSRSVPQIYGAAMSCKAGGVGKYMHSDFVHMDCGPVRHWIGV
ncbi:peptidase M15 [mine drainage metagenome]|uniref:Murein endopeptidase K n=1 Tax=mine drainage metagenome TaxID=410659 RepID=A0A1J5PMP2_9ZZZZ